MDNRHIPYLNAIIAADIHGRAKLTLTMLIDSMDFDTHQTYIGQTALAKKMGVSYSAAAEGIDLLQELKLIEFVGFHPIHPGSAKATNAYRIVIQPLEDTVGDSATVGDSTIGKKPTVVDLPNNHIQSNGGSDSWGGGKGSNGVERAHTYTHTDALAHNTKNDTETDQTHGSWSEEEIKVLVSIFSFATDAQLGALASSEKFVSEGTAALRSYKGGLSAQRLALLMWWAFGISGYWSKQKNWTKGLDMENFLRAARTLDNQIEKWRGLPKWEKRYARAFDVLDWYIEKTERREARKSPKPETKKFSMSDFVKDGPPKYLDDGGSSSSDADDIRKMLDAHSVSKVWEIEE